MNEIRIRGARTHNLKNVDLDLPRDKLIVFTGLSGSGKSSLAFDTLYAEGQRRYVESLSAYARQFLSMMEKPDVDLIEGLSPAISIEQKSTSHNPRSTVGTVTEIYDYLRLLFARVGQPRCPEHGTTLEAQTISQMVDAILELPEETKLMILAPVVRARKGEYVQLCEDLRGQGFIRARIDGEVYELENAPELSLHKKHTIEVVVDRIKVRADVRQRLAESLETAVNLTDGLVKIADMDSDKEQVFSAKYACPICGYSIAELEPRLFSFNNPVGACPECDGLGLKNNFDPEKIITDPELSLAEGAVRGWDRRNLYYFSMLTSLAKHYDVTLETPFNELPADFRQIILFGSGKEKIKFSYIIGRRRRIQRTHPFEGVIPIMERRYKETESVMMREELAKYLTQDLCPSCQGARLKKEARNVFIGETNLPTISALTIEQALEFFEALTLPGYRGEIAEKILKEVTARLRFLVNVGLNYLSLARSADTLSGGEAQRIRLASQIGSGLVGVMYVLDEPTIGLHQRDNERLIETLVRLRDLGNTVIVVEHDADTMRMADHVVDIGIGAGIHGGRIIAEGTCEQIIANKESLTGKYLSGELTIPMPKTREKYDPKRVIYLQGVSKNNLKNIDANIPVGLLTCITGVSGSGKSSLINDTLYPLVAKKLNRAAISEPTAYKNITGLGLLDKVVDIDQSPIGRTPRSNPATYTGLFTPIRELFANTQEARARGYQVGRFSFNVKGGRCEACQGDGLIKVEMHFLSDVYVVCDACKGKRYNRETLEITYKGKNIADVLAMTVEEAVEFFAPVPQIAHKLQTLIDVGLGYIHLGQSATTLSGGEAQRVKLAKELSKRDTGNTLYMLDEPTTGLHFHDVKHLLEVLHRLRERGNTVVVIEHNLDVIKTADWVIDLGPEGGDKGGEIIVAGTPEDVAKCKKSYTGKFLSNYM
ncbi:MAG: excinuclease ABC subunit UvrA [Gammaproteobacteria bacterium]|nr:excinuclease ABC subunit UvrA [Gammaproteobacteria bacterium]